MTYNHAVAETWRRVWGDGQIFHGPRFLNDGFFGKKVHFFHGKNFFDDLFLVIDQIFRIFTFFSKIFRIFTMLNVAYDLYMTLSSQEKKLFQKRIPFSYSVRIFAHIGQHYFSKYWTVPPVPPRSPPLHITL